MQAILIAGGQGTRLRPFTLSTPKPLLALCGRPVMEYQIDRVKQAGLRRVIFAISHHADLVRQYFGNGDDYGMTFQYALEDAPLGTAGAIRNCAPFLDGELSVVFNADVLCDLPLADIIDFHRTRGAQATLHLTPVEDPSRYGVVPTDDHGWITAFIEKPPRDMAPTNYINGGLYILNDEIIQGIPHDRAVSIERETYPSLIAKGARLAGYLHDGYWLDIGTAESFVQAHWDLLEHRAHGAVGAGEVAPGLFLASPDTILANVTLIPPVFIDEKVTFEGPATLGPRVVLNEGCTVAANLTLTETVALPGTRIETSPAPGTILASGMTRE